MMKMKVCLLGLLCLFTIVGTADAVSFGSRQNVGSTSHPALDEQSGICMSRNNPHIIWIQEDSGTSGDDYIYAVTTNGTCVGVYAISGFSNADWEDIAIGPGPIAGIDYLYIGDIGDNQSDDATQTIARVPEPVVSPTQPLTTNTLYGADIITVEYAGGFMMDAESLMVDSSKNIYIVGKRTGSDFSPSATPRLYLAAYPQSTSGINTMSLEGTISITGNAMPTGADIAPSGEQILIKIGGNGFFGPEEVWHWSVGTGESITDALITSPVKTEATTYSDSGQCEAVGWKHNDGGFYTISEGASQPLYFYDNLDVGEYRWLDTATAGNGGISHSDQWIADGSNLVITATADPFSSFTAWSGDTNGCTIAGTQITVPMTQDRQISASFAVTPNTIPYVETFESHTNGHAMVGGAAGWQADSSTNALVSTNAAFISSLAAYSEPCGYPVAAANHAKVLEVGGTTTNLFDTGANQVVWMDKMIQPVFGSLETDAAVLAGAKAGYSFNPAGHPAIWNKDLAGGTNRWTVLDDITIIEGDWVRLTFKLDYQTDDSVNNVRYFQVYFDGTLVTNAAAWTVNDGTGSLGGTWFAMTSEPDQLNYLSLKSAAMDDLVVNTDDPFTVQFITPIEGVPYEDWTIVNYVDLDSSGAIADYRGGNHTYDGHDAIDYTLPNFAAMDAGVDVYAAEAGTVIEVHDGEYDRYSRANPWPGGVSANYVKIDHGNGIQTYYWHLKKNSILVSVNDAVTQGQKIAEVGSSGSSSDAHLHFAVYQNSSVVETYLDTNTWWTTPLSYAGDVAGALDWGVLDHDPTLTELVDRPVEDDIFLQSDGAGQEMWFWVNFHGVDTGNSLDFYYYKPDDTEYAHFHWDVGEFGYGWWETVLALPDVPDAGTWDIVFQINGQTVATDTFIVQAPVNNPPVFTVDPMNRSDAMEDSAYGDTIAGSATDADLDTLAYSKVSGPTWLNVAASGALSGTPALSDAGTNTWSVQVDDGNGGTDMAILEIVVHTILPKDNVALSETTTHGTVSGTLADSQVNDDLYEAITEAVDGTPTSLLEHEWTFDVYGAELVTFYVEAHRTANSEGDDFVFAYSTDGSSWTDMVTVTKTADDDTVQWYALPSGLDGTVYVRVMDADRSVNNTAQDTIYVDALFIYSEESTVAPNPATTPVPANGASDVPTTQVLSWTAGAMAVEHDVYFGTSPSPAFQVTQSNTTYDPGPLSGGTTYYWAVDEVNNSGTTAGSLWSFTTVAGGPVDDVANGETLVSGTMAGSYLDTQVSDNAYEALTEIESGGKPSNRHSLLEHIWTINVTGGNSVTFHVEAYHAANSEGDDFVFAYSTDNVNFTDMVTVTKTADDDVAQSFVLPNTLSGTVYIRVKDTDQSQGNKALDTVYIDEMHIRSDGEAPPNNPPTFNSDPVVEANATENAAYSSTLADDASDPESDPMSFSKVSGPAWLAVASDGSLSGTPGAGDVGANAFTVQVDATGGSDTATLNITVDEAGSLTDIYVDDIAMGSGSYGGNRYSGIATITIKDEFGVVMPNATVSVDWTGAAPGSDSGTTDGSGVVAFESSKVKNGGTYTVTVTDVTASGSNYNAALNVETSDSITAP